MSVVVAPMARMNLKPLLVPAALVAASFASAQIRLTEYMYQGAFPSDLGEFFEFRNFGTAPIDLADWSLDDDSNVPNTVDLSPLGTIAPGEIFLITDVTEAEFRSNWTVPADVKILSKPTPGFGRADTLYLYDATDANRLTFAYGDAVFPGSFRTQRVSANVPLAEIGATQASGNLPLSVVGDTYGSTTSGLGEIGNPGVYAPAAVPEPASLAALALGAVAVLRRRKRA